MRKLFLLAFSPLIIGSLALMTYYGIISNDIGEKVFAVIAITLFITWLVNPTLLEDTLFEDEDAQSKKDLSIKRTAIFLIFVLLGTSFIVFSHSVFNFVEKAVFDDCGIYDCSFNRCNFTACTFDFCTSDEDWPIKNIEFVDCKGEFLTATYCNFENITMKNCSFKFLNIKDSSLSEFYANNCSMASACFDESAFNVVKFTDCDLTGINGEIAIIDNGSEFRDCNLTGSELRAKSLLIINSHKGIDVVNGNL